METHTHCGVIGGEATLLIKNKVAVLFDSGFDFCADALAAKIKATLGDIPLQYIVLTHSHYDHLGGCVGVQQLYPQAKIVANPLVRPIVAKESARNTMRELNKQAAEAAGWPLIDRIDQLKIDIDLAPGETLETGLGPMLSIATPGHTRCSTSYYFPEDKTLVLCETTGVIVEQHLVPCFIVSYKSTMESFDRCAALNAERLVVPHYGGINGESATRFLKKSRIVTSDAAEMVLDLYHMGKTEDEIFEAYAKRYYYGLCDTAQPMMAFSLNTRAMMARLIAEDEQQKATQA